MPHSLPQDWWPDVIFFLIFFFLRSPSPVSGVTEVVGLAEQGWELQS